MRRLLGNACLTDETIVRKWTVHSTDTLTERAAIYAQIALAGISGLPLSIEATAAFNIARAMEKYAEADRAASRPLPLQETEGD